LCHEERPYLQAGAIYYTIMAVRGRGRTEMRLTKADRWLVGTLLAAAVGGIALNMFLLSGAGAQEAHVYKDGKFVQAIRLRPGYREELRLGGQERYNLVVADNGRVRVAEADCPDQVCVRTGWVSVAPQQIVCLPYRVVIKVVSSAPPDVDDITK
jgi:hypothetical protein